MGRRARDVFETVLAEDVAFDSLVQRLEPLVASGTAGRFRRRLIDRRYASVALRRGVGSRPGAPGRDPPEPADGQMTVAIHAPPQLR